MVGKRTFIRDSSYKRDVDSPPLSRNNSVAAGPPKTGKPKLFKFSDREQTELEEQRRRELKDKLIFGAGQYDFEKCRVSDEDLKEIKNKKVKKFYKDQNERINDWLEVDAVVTALADDVLESFNPDPDRDGVPENAGALQNIGEDVEAFLPDDERKKRRKAEKRAKLAININVIANILLLIAKIGAVFYSDSLSLIASLVDSALDLLCTIIVWSTNKIVNWRLSSLKAAFPVGRKRLEPLGILVFSIIMVISFMQILQESFQKLLPSGEHKVAELPPVAIGAMAATIIVKGIIWIGCIPIKTTQVQALAQDCKTDVFFNTLSLLFPIIGSQADAWWVDPAGAGILAIFIIFDWGATCFHNVVRLSGSQADERMHRKIMYVAYRFSELVDGFKSVRAYHAGDGVWTEIDILLDPQEKLMDAHDVSETLQYCLEGLNEVDRAFVSVDYAMHGPTGHSSGTA